MENELEYMKAHPPRCLGKDFKEPDSRLAEYLKSELGENSTSFTPICICGNALINIKKPGDYGPISISCPNCTDKRIVFDPASHGYDGELGHNDGTEHDELVDHTCPQCGIKDCEIAIAFQYSGETDILEDEDAPDIKPEDLYGWMMVASLCHSCNAVFEVTQQECA